jgi:hypothetical protein
VNNQPPLRSAELQHVFTAPDHADHAFVNVLAEKEIVDVG